MSKLCLPFCVAFVVGVAFADASDELSGVETWGGRKAHPAIVNPVLGDEPGTVVSLAGEWDFITQPWRHNFWVSRPGKGLLAPVSKKDPVWTDARKLRVPGVWEDQGVGTNGVSKCWDCAWDGGTRKIRHFFNGCGVYRREVTIPADWKGKRIWLKTGWAFAAACFWVNGEQVAMDWNYCATYKYDITDLVKPGETALITAEVSNAFPSLRGNFASHNRYGGLYRAPELEATPETFIDDAWVRGDFDKHLAEVHVEIAGMRDEGRGMRVRMIVEDETKEVDLYSAPTPKTYTSELPLRQFRPWSPEHPNLYTAKVELVSADGKVLQVRRERFGVRKFEVRGKDICLNGAPYFIRGVGFHNLEPIHGVRPADRDYIRRQLRGVKAAGFNAMRLHTRCESPEFFEMADELGLLVQPELPYYGDAPCENFGFDPMREVKELYTHFRRHPSFAFYSLGNEGTFGKYLDRKIHQWVKATDPDRIKLNQDIEWGWNKYCEKDVSELECAPPKEWSRDEYDPDRPFICHEYLNLAVKANPRLDSQYTGLWETPYTLESRKAWLAKRGLTMLWGDRLQRAQHLLQRYWLRHGIEMARSDKHCDGYWYWSYFDSTTKTGDAFSAQSLFDPFGNPKPYGETAETFAVINSPSGVFATFTNDCRIAAAGDVVRVDLRAAHYGETDLADAMAVWQVTADGRTLASGKLPIGTLVRGGGRDIGTLSFAVPTLETSVAAELSVEIVATASSPSRVCANAWRLYLLSKREIPTLHDVAVSAKLMPQLASRYRGLLVEADLDKAVTLVADASETNLIERALAADKRVVSIAPAKKVPNVKLGWWWMGSQVGTAIADHPFLRFLPHDGALDPLFFRIIGEGRPLPYAGMDERNMSIVGEGKNDCYLYLGEAKRGGGLVIVEGLDVLADLPEAKALLDGIILAEPRLAENGVAKAEIVIPDAATAVEKSAAAELAEGLKKVTGAKFPVVAEAQATVGMRLYVGATKVSRARRGRSPRPTEADAWRMDEVLVDNVDDGIVLDGHPDRGPIYAVDCYLERELGVRWWTSKAAHYPKNASPAVKVTRYSHASPFKFRETYFLDAFDPDFKVRSKLNYTSVCRYEFDRNQRIPKEKGGDSTLYFFKGRGSAYHSAFEVLPPKKYFDAHPEWYSFVRGKRQPKQLCCTNREMLDEYVRVTKELLRAAPDCNFIQCSQNDDWDPCWCEKCSAVKDAEGGAHGANNLRMANAVAEAIEDEFPNVWVDTFAYQYTRKAPKLTKPRANVLVRLCSVECGFNRPISDPSYQLNAKFAHDLEEWSKVGAGHLFVWDYVVNFSSYMLPHPTILNFADNVRTFAKAGAVGLFEQGDATCSAGEFAPLRFYLLSKLAWDPSLDENRLIDEFLAGYYGTKAAPHLKAYLVHMHEAAKAGPPMTIFHEKISSWIRPEAFFKGAELMQAAYAAAQADGSVFAERVRREKLSVDHAFIVEWDLWKKWADEHKVAWPRPALKRVAVDEWIAACKELKVRSYRETTDPGKIETYFEKLREAVGD